MALTIFLIILYFVPAVTAYENKKKNKQAILVINIFLGWTFIGWIVALAMAVGKNTENNTNELEKLSQLKDKGIITEEEFSTQKKKLLS